MSEYINLIGSVGFPIVACIYMATTMQKSIEKNTEVIQKNTNLLDKILDKLNIEVSKDE